MRHRLVAALSLALALVLSLAASAATRGHHAPRCRPDPYPCGPAWPDGLSGPFALGPLEHVQVPAADGVPLDGWVQRPAVPAGVKLPVVLVTSPYLDLCALDTCYRDPATRLTAPQRVGNVTGPGWFDDVEPMAFDVDAVSIGFPPVRLVRRGYALAYFSTRGTGSSGGCFEFGGPAEQRDQSTLVQWLSDRPWSNHRVGISGLSYMAYSATMAAVEAPPALKTVVTAGDMTDLFQWAYSAEASHGVAFNTSLFDALLSNLGGTAGGSPPPSRATCPHSTVAPLELTSLLTGDRGRDFWQPRQFQERLPAVRAAWLDTSGYYDTGPHQAQDSAIWGSLDPKTPRVRFSGFWGHTFPEPGTQWATHMPPGIQSWEAYVEAWLDYWLKGIGSQPELDVVHHQDQLLGWHKARSWSPEPGGREVLYLGEGRLSAVPLAGEESFRSVPPPADHAFAEHFEYLRPDPEGTKLSLCPTAATVGLSQLFTTPPLTSDVLVAGNPFAYLDVSSDQPGGVVSAELFDLAPDFACTGPEVKGAWWLGSGSVDLAYLADPFVRHDAAVGVPLQVRVDLSDITFRLQTGHRLALVLSHGEAFERLGTTTFPVITVHGGAAGRPPDPSQLVVPVAEGTLGGDHPKIRYPQRPFTPRGYRD
jgi:predicted acyl esterase